MKKDKYQTMIDNFQSVAEAIKMGLASSTIYRLIDENKLKVYMRGSTKLVLKKDVLKMLGES